MKPTLGGAGAPRVAQIPAAARRRLDRDTVIWLTTVTEAGGPFPTPVWFVVDDGDLVVFSAASSRKVANIRRRPSVCLHFNSDPDGQDVVVVTGTARVVEGIGPIAFPGYMDKYRDRIPRLRMTPAEFQRAHDTCIRVTPEKVRL